MKKIEKQIEIAATSEEVWRALTDAEELKRWFPIDARVKPGKGGAIWFSFGESQEWESPIEVWKPGQHLRTVDTTPAGRVAVDYTIESRGGTTILRLVHSGFADDTWEDELDTMGSGWATFLANLKHYLERHRGEPRTMAFFRHPPVPLPRPEVFHRTLALLGLQDTGLRAGQRYSTTTRSGHHLEGEVRVFAPPINFTATIDNWDNSFLMVEIEPGRERCRPAIWCSLYGRQQVRAREVQEMLTALLQKEFA